MTNRVINIINIIYNYIYIIIEIIIDSEYDKIIKIPDVLNDGQLPENKLLQQASSVKVESKKGNPNMRMFYQFQ